MGRALHFRVGAGGNRVVQVVPQVRAVRAGRLEVLRDVLGNVSRLDVGEGGRGGRAQVAREARRFVQDRQDVHGHTRRVAGIGLAGTELGVGRVAVAIRVTREEQLLLGVPDVHHLGLDEVLHVGEHVPGRLALREHEVLGGRDVVVDRVGQEVLGRSAEGSTRSRAVEGRARQVIGLVHRGLLGQTVEQRVANVVRILDQEHPAAPVELVENLLPTVGEGVGRVAAVLIDDRRNGRVERLGVSRERHDSSSSLSGK